MSEYSFLRYLKSKIAVDDRALNKSVQNAAYDFLKSRSNPVSIAELGGGVGTMFTRLMKRLPESNFDYTIVDQDDALIGHAFEYIAEWCAANNCEFNLLEKNAARIKRNGGATTLRLVQADAAKFLAAKTRAYDLVVAHAFLDLVDINAVLPLCFQSLKEGGGYYFSINYDGETRFEPVWNPALEEKILEAYNESMNQNPEGLSQRSTTGRRLPEAIVRHGGRVVAWGRSDWLVGPVGGIYPCDEGYFLWHILHFFETSLSGFPGIVQQELDDWLTERRRQITARELVYTARQFDFFGLLN